ncbi:MAG: DNA/RNA non-specific endonuclease [Alkalispirochaeta sp.]
MIRWALVILLFAVVPQFPGAQEIHSEHFYFGMPAGTPRENDLIIRDLYALSANETTRFADWVAYRLTPAEVWGDLDLEREWRADPWLDDDERLEPSGPDDYGGAYRAYRYDRGHLAPLGSFVGSPAASSVNYYSNIVPQTAQLNRGPWRILEETVRELVLGYHEVFVVVGTLYDGPAMPALPEADEEHTVPTGFWKVVVVPALGDDGVGAYIMPQQGFTEGDPAAFLTSIDEVERRSGLSLFPQRTDEGWERLERGTSTPSWE